MHQYSTIAGLETHRNKQNNRAIIHQSIFVVNFCYFVNSFQKTKKGPEFQGIFFSNHHTFMMCSNR